MSDYKPEKGKPETWVPGVTVFANRCGCIEIYTGRTIDRVYYRTISTNPCTVSEDQSHDGCAGTFIGSSKFSDSLIPRLDLAVDRKDNLLHNGNYIEWNGKRVPILENRTSPRYLHLPIIEDWGIEERKMVATEMTKCDPPESTAKIRTKPNRYATEAEDAIAEQLDKLEARKSQPCASPQIRYAWGIGRQCRCGRPWGECGDPATRPRRIARADLGTCETCGEQEISGLCDPIDGGCRICSDCYSAKLRQFDEAEDRRILDQADEIRQRRESEAR